VVDLRWWIERSWESGEVRSSVARLKRKLGIGEVVGFGMVVGWDLRWGSAGVLLVRGWRELMRRIVLWLGNYDFLGNYTTSARSMVVLCVMYSNPHADAMFWYSL
jgi:hypothetical protein